MKTIVKKMQDITVKMDKKTVNQQRKQKGPGSASVRGNLVKEKWRSTK